MMRAKAITADKTQTPMLKSIVGAFAASPLMRRGKTLYEANKRDWEMPLSKWDKALVGLYLISRDYATGEFPPVFNDRQAAYQAEIDYQHALPGMSTDTVKEINLRKPFWGGVEMARYFDAVSFITDTFAAKGIEPPNTLLELGCGAGWMSEMLALIGYSVVGTTISPHDTDDAKLRIESLRIKNLHPNLAFVTTPMEEVCERTKDLGPMDGALVYEALHHAFDWRQTCKSVYEALRPGGYFMICDEPNVLHTYVSYRVARLSNTHEIGFSRKELTGCLRQCGFTEIEILRNSIGFLYRPHWILARRPLTD